MDLSYQTETSGRSILLDYEKRDNRARKKNSSSPEKPFYGTLFHEMVHSTGAEGVLDRLQPTSFGSKEYAREELVAELGSALIAQRYGMTKHIKEDSCAYLKGWLDELKESPQFIKTTLLDVKRASSIVTQKGG